MNKKNQSYLQLIIAIVIIILLNAILSNYFFRIDLTKEKRYTLAEPSKKLAAKVKEGILVKVYLEGDFPAGFKRLQKATKEMLDEFKIYSNNNIQYEFIDPLTNTTAKQSNEILQELSDLGLQATNIQLKKEDGFSQKIIVPGAVLYYGDRKIPINLLKSQFGQAPEAVINTSIEQLEYEIANALRKVTQTEVKRLAFLKGNGELEKWNIIDGKAELKQYYEIDDIDLSVIPPNTLFEYTGVIVPKPTLPFSDFDKFKLDQYVMHGGKIIWLVESQLADMDSLRNSPQYYSISYNLGIEDLFYKFGVRINNNIVQDLMCNSIPVLSGMKNGTPEQKLLPWMYFPVVPPTSSHPIVRGVDPIWFQFASSIDTIPSKKIKKTILLASSPYSRVVPAPARVDIELARLEPDENLFRTGGNKTMAILLEGEFSSSFEFIFDKTKNPELDFKPKVENNKMIIISDGDVIRNQYSQSKGQVFPLGYDRYANQQFGNKRFLLNCVDYLCDDSGIIEVRSKEVTLRLLDKAKIKREKLFWQFINIGLPIILILIFAIANNFYRKRKYA
ncbi:MAG: gliding motility-associated ABC transporter substrate-binding protein GldG [Bacteroidota bacterium]|jgi:ABC-2 type transport system permease protein